MKNILIIIGSASKNSTNHAISNFIVNNSLTQFSVTLFDQLTSLPHFSTELSEENTPNAIEKFRNLVQKSDGVIVVTPEYIFSIPSGLKNAFEWCVSKTIFQDKPMGLITAGASGQKGHEELQLIVETLMGRFTQETTLLISGAKGKVNYKSGAIEAETKSALTHFIQQYEALLLS